MLLRLTTMRYFLSRKEQESVVVVKEELLHSKIQKKEDAFRYLTTNSLRKAVWNIMVYGGLWRLQGDWKVL